MTNSYGSRSTLSVSGKTYDIFRLDALDKAGIATTHLPFSLRVLLENLLRTEDGRVVRAEDIAALAKWDAKAEPSREISFTPSRVLLQDFTGVPAVVDLAAMRPTMVNGLGVLGGGVGGIEAEAAMLGQPVSMLIPQVVGFKLTGELREGSTATDLVLTVTQMLRKRGVVGKFVEFYGSGLRGLPLADRATIANMAPEDGATCGIFPVDVETIRYLRLTSRPYGHIAHDD